MKHSRNTHARGGAAKPEGHPRVLAAALAFLALSVSLAAVVPGEATITYRLCHVPTADGVRWVVDVVAEGLDPDRGPLTFAFDSWGGWPRHGDAFQKDFRVEHPDGVEVRGGPATRELVPPPGWDGSLRLHYEIQVVPEDSDLHREVGLMPYVKGSYCQGFSANTVGFLRQGGEAPAARLRMELSAPAGTTIVTGWGGASVARQEVELARDDENTVIAFGVPTGRARQPDPGGDFEVVQFGAGEDVAAVVAPMVRALVRRAEEVFGQPLGEPLRVVLIDSGGGGTCVEHAVVVGYAAEDDTDGTLGLGFRHTLAHEILHQWLGSNFLLMDESFIWFKEGFTEYLALWFAAHLGWVDAREFCERLELLDALARSSPAYGQVAFGQPDVNWRDGDGANESLAYRGGALLAFFADTELRAFGHPGLPELVADLIDAGKPMPAVADLRAWMEEHDLAGFYAEHVDAPGLPELGEGFSRIGCGPRAEDTQLTYVGLATDAPGPFGTITAVDPEGPGARAGFRVGDAVNGFWPSRQPWPRVQEGVHADFPFGLEFFEPGHVIHVGVWRGEENLTVDVLPSLVPGGIMESFELADPEEYAAFLEYRAD